MIEIKEIQLDVTLPDDGIGMVIMQPFVELCGQEPYCWQNNKKNKQIERIVRTLEIAKQSDHGCEKTHFTIFPEYSIPGLEGVKKIQEILESNSWEEGTIVIGGIDGLTKKDYLTLISEDITKICEENEPDRKDYWINCCVIWAKQTNGTVKKWVQPKLVPATQEELCPAYHMLTGKVVYIFKPSISIQDSKLPFRFLCFICKDWIGNIGGSSVVNMVLSQLSEQRRVKGIDDRLDIYLYIVLQRNPKPDYPLFLQSTVQYLKENWCLNIRRSDGAVLFVNNAGSNSAGHCKEFGKSGFIFPPNCSLVSHKECCPPTYTLKNRDGITSCKEARFRESGACIVSFKFTPPIPAIFRRSPETPRIPINPAIVHSIDIFTKRAKEDPRTPGKEVPASIKWINDRLDGIEYLLENKREHPLYQKLRIIHHVVCKEIRKENNEFLCKYITMASCEIEEEKDKWIEIEGRKIHNVDNWDENEKQNLKTVVYSISLIKVCIPLKIKGSLAHGTIKVRDKVIDVIIVSGKTHEECYKYAKNKYPGSG